MFYASYVLFVPVCADGPYRKSLIDLLGRSFQTVNQKQVEAFVVDLFNYCRDQNPARFQQHMRDFLISLKVMHVHLYAGVVPVVAVRPKYNV